MESEINNDNCYKKKVKFNYNIKEHYNIDEILFLLYQKSSYYEYLEPNKNLIRKMINNNFNKNHFFPLIKILLLSK